MSARFELHRGNNLEVLRGMADASVDAVVTDPPYELGFMGRAWDASGVAYSVPMWTEVLRVLKPGGHLLSFGGSRTYHRMACAIEDAGFEVRDQLMWLYGSGMPKSHNLRGEHEGWGTGLKPAHEPICMARRPFRGSVAANVLVHGTGALNIDGCRVHADDAQGREYTVKRFAPGASVNADGKRNQDAEYTGASNPGRWPANVLHDGSDEVVVGFPESVGQKGDLSEDESARAGQNAYNPMRRGRAPSEDPRGFRMPPGQRREDDGSAARFFYCAKASPEDRHEGLAHPGRQFVQGSTKRHAEKVSASKRGNHHPTVKPTDLMRYLCRLVTPPGAVVLDPFMGSGSTGKAAMLEGFRFIGIELDEDADGAPLGFMEIARARIEFAARMGHQPSLLEAA